MEKQPTFIHRQTNNYFFLKVKLTITYECLHFMRIKRNDNNHHCALKLDMMMAYDHVVWPYLQAVMLKSGINLHFTYTIMNCVSLI
jgi:hypothetical protein